MSVIDPKDMDQLVRFVTELGVASIQPLIAQRSNIRSISDKRIERWKGIIDEAVKQCERREIPVIHQARPLKDFIEAPPRFWETRLVASLDAEESLHAGSDEEVGILIGPEGGFSLSEMEEIQKHGFTPVSMGKTVMRALTAAITAVGILGM